MNQVPTLRPGPQVTLLGSNGEEIPVNGNNALPVNNNNNATPQEEVVVVVKKAFPWMLVGGLALLVWFVTRKKK